jgi:hypothetical protein
MAFHFTYDIQYFNHGCEEKKYGRENEKGGGDDGKKGGDKSKGHDEDKMDECKRKEVHIFRYVYEIVLSKT